MKSQGMKTKNVDSDFELDLVNEFKKNDTQEFNLVTKDIEQTCHRTLNSFEYIYLSILALMISFFIFYIILNDDLLGFFNNF